MQTPIYDYIVVGSGFGGSVSAMRLSEKGYKVLVIEKGKRFAPKDFATTDWNVPKYLWAPLLKCFGILKLTLFKEVFVMSGVGVGGGSLVYANTHFVPPDAFFENPVWKDLKDWKKTLLPFYELAQKMLGSTRYQNLQTEDFVLKEVAQDMSRGDSFGAVKVGVYFGDTEKSTDPYFKGLGPKREGCQNCAACMIGCRHNAKNTLDKNYLYFAEKFGAEILAERLVTKIEYIDNLYHIHTESSTSWFKKDKQVFVSKGLVMSGGVLGTMDLLLRQKYVQQTLPLLSDKLGENVRTNSESLCGVVLGDRKLNNGVAITSYFNPDDDTHIEVVKYNNTSGVLSRLGIFAGDGNSSWVRIFDSFMYGLKNPFAFLKFFTRFTWGDDAIIFLVMQNLDSSLKMIYKKSWLGGKLSFDKNAGRVPAYIPIGQEVMRRYASKVNGIGMNNILEVAKNTSTTAHILGGCVMGKEAKTGVVNEFFEVHNYPNMFVLDGSIIPCNLGVNPSLSITALSEYAMANIPEKAGNQQKSLEKLMEEVG